MEKTLRDEFAIEILKAILISEKQLKYASNGKPLKLEDFPRAAYGFADDMLKQREEQ